MMAKHGMRAVCVGLLALSFGGFTVTAAARGASPYLPLNLAPDIERQIERVLILAGKPVMSRPIAAAAVLDALPRACQVDRALCKRVEEYLRIYMRPYGVTSAKPEIALTDGDSEMAIPNRHGQSVDSAWQLSASGYAQLGDYVIVNAGGIVNEDEATATGSFVSLGFDFAQLDIGFRDHWLSPFTDSSSLISTEAPTMPSITLSNYRPLTPLGFSYQVFAAEMSRQEEIRYLDTTTSGNPRLAGMQLAIEPVTGYALALNRETQYGGGARNGGAWSDFVDALGNNGNNPDAVNSEDSNKVASLTSSILFPGKVPFAVHIEYAGEDNAYATGYRLGAINLSLGIDLPRLWKVFDATFEISEWQNSWYVHHIYPEGLTNEHSVVGHWFGDNREFGNAIGGRSEMLAVGWQRRADQYLRATYRTMALDPRWVREGTVPPYKRLHSLGVNLATDWRGYPLELELSGGQDIFGESFARLAASIDFSGQAVSSSAMYDDDDHSSGAELFIDAGMNQSTVTKILAVGGPNPPDVRGEGAHVAFGARRSASERGDIGVRLELDQIDGDLMLSLRALDYRYRLLPWLGVSGFAGFARYDYGLATNGYYWGGGLQLRDVLPKWDVGVDFRHYEKLNRDKSLPTDPVPSPQQHPRLYIDIDGISLYVTRRW
jgi:Capsule assembly protein Wzi